MGKKSKSKALQKKVDNEESEEELETTESAGTEGWATPVRSTTPVRNKGEESCNANISETVEKLLEKRFTTRENGLEQLIRHFQSSHEKSTSLSIDGYQDTIMTQLVRIIRKPYSVKEGKLCANLLSLMGLYVGADEEDFFASVEKPLKQLVDGTDPELQGLRDSALTCLVMLAFICGGVDAGYRTWSYCERILTQQNVLYDGENDSEAETVDSSDDSSTDSKSNATRDVKSGVALRASAASGWILLATLRTSEEVLQHCTGEFLPDGGSLLDPLLELLEYRDGGGQSGIDIKIRAGKALAYLWEVAGEVLPNAEPSVAGALLCNDPHTVQQILEVIKQNSKECGKHISKKDRKEQRTEFRAIGDWVLKGQPPLEPPLRMQGAVLEVATFGELHVLDALKEVLGSGFHSALRMFPVVKEVLGVEYLADAMDGAGEDLKVNKGSSADKSRSNGRKQDRRFREINLEYSFEECGGEDDA